MPDGKRDAEPFVLNVAAGSTVSMRGASLAIDHTGAATPRAAIVSLINSNRIVGANVIGMAETSELGVTTFGGAALDSTALILLNTLAGDTNLDRAVNFADLLNLASHYNTSANTTWFRGDFNYDNQIGFADLLALASSYGQSLLSDGTIEENPTLAGSFDADWARALALVPEPASLTALGAAAVLLARRRRDGR